MINRLDRAWYLGYEYPQNYLQVEYLDEMPDNLERPAPCHLKCRS